MYKHVISIVIAILFACYAVAAHPEERPNAVGNHSTTVAESTVVDAYSFVGLKIGMTEQEVSNVLPRLSFKDRGPIRQASGFVPMSELNGALVEREGEAILDLTIVANRLVNISVRWLPSAFEAMLPKLEKQLGPPLSAETSRNVTRAGDAFTNTIAIWSDERTTVQYFQRFENIKQSRLLLMERPKKKP